MLTGIYMLATGSIANYLAGILPIRPPGITSRVQVQAYGRIFAQIGWGAAGCALAVIAVLGGWWLLARRQARTVNA